MIKENMWKNVGRGSTMKSSNHGPRFSTPFNDRPTSPTAPTLPGPTEAVVTPQTISQVGPDQYPDNVDPLTGLEVVDATLLNRRPLAVKVSEFPRRVRPQDGLSYADLVFEHYAE